MRHAASAAHSRALRSRLLTSSTYRPLPLRRRRSSSLRTGCPIACTLILYPLNAVNAVRRPPPERRRPWPKPGPKPRAKPCAEAAGKAMVEMMEPLHDDDRRREAKVPGRAGPIRKELGIGVVDRIRVVVRVGRGGGRRHLVDLRRQSRRILRDLPAPVGLRAGLDDRLPRLPADGDRSGIAAARRLASAVAAARRRGCSPRRPAGPAAPRHRSAPASRACSAPPASCRPAARTPGRWPAPASPPPLPGP